MDLNGEILLINNWVFHFFANQIRTVTKSIIALTVRLCQAVPRALDQNIALCCLSMTWRNNYFVIFEPCCFHTSFERSIRVSPDTVAMPSKRLISEYSLIFHNLDGLSLFHMKLLSFSLIFNVIQHSIVTCSEDPHRNNMGTLLCNEREMSSLQDHMAQPVCACLQTRPSNYGKRWAVGLKTAKPTTDSKYHVNGKYALKSKMLTTQNMMKISRFPNR